MEPSLTERLRLRDLSAFLTARAPAGARFYAAGCAGEPTGVAEALIASGFAVEGATWSGVWIPGVNAVDWSCVGPGARSETIFLSPALRESFVNGRVAFVPNDYVQTYTRLHETPCDVAIASITPPDAAGAVSLGVAADFTPAVFDHAAVRIGLVRPDMPRPASAPTYPANAFDALIEAEAPVLTAPDPDLDPVFNAIGAGVADRIEDGDTVQLGLGKVQVGVLRALHGHRDIGVHAGMVSDSVRPLLDTDVVTRVTTGVALGSPDLYDQVASDERVRFEPVAHTHAPSTLANVPRLKAINSVIEVDLFGQANAEFLGPRQISGGGGLVNFLRGARASTGGEAILALASTAKGGRVSRIVPRLGDGAVTVARADVDTVITEHGAALVRGLDLDARANALIAIADPEHRADLAAAWDAMRRAM